MNKLLSFYVCFFIFILGTFAETPNNFEKGDIVFRRLDGFPGILEYHSAIFLKTFPNSDPNLDANQEIIEMTNIRTEESNLAAFKTTGFCKFTFHSIINKNRREK